ncbi:hypothetical protein AWH62_02225 [Maricaulis sp. W15]|nr:hypothetical protein AWH62_02225 [Maricaulis sp. W15]
MSSEKLQLVRMAIKQIEQKRIVFNIRCVECFGPIKKLMQSYSYASPKWRFAATNSVLRGTFRYARTNRRHLSRLVPQFTGLLQYVSVVGLNHSFIQAYCKVGKLPSPEFERTSAGVNG